MRKLNPWIVPSIDKMEGPDLFLCSLMNKETGEIVGKYLTTEEIVKAVMGYPTLHRLSALEKK